MANTNVKVTFIGDSSDLNRAIDDVDGKAGGLKSKLGGLGALAAGAGVAVLGKGLLDAGKAFAEDESGAAALAKTLQSVAGATDDQIASNEKFINKMQNASGVLDDDLRPALGTLVRGTGDLTQAQKLLSLSMDISAGTGKDLGSVTEALSKAANGNFKSLKALDPALGALIKDGASTDEIMGALAQTFAGQTAVAADTTAGKIAIAKARFTDIQEEIGAKVVPVMAALAEFIATTLIPTIESITHWLEEHKAVAIVLAVVIGGALVAAFVAWAIAAASAAAATIAATWPVLAIIAAIALLAAGIIYAYTHWGWFKTAVDAVADAATWLWQNVLQPFAGWLANNFVTILETVGRVALAAMTGGMSEAAIFIYHHWDDIIAFFKGLPDKIWEALSGVAEAIMHPFIVAFDWIRNAWDSSVGGIFDKISSVGSKVGGALGHIPGFADGGTVPGAKGEPMLAIVHGGEQVIPNGATAGRVTAGGLTVNVYGNVYGERDLFGMINKGLRNGLTIG